MWKSAIKRDHNFYRKSNIFSVKSTFYTFTKEEVTKLRVDFTKFLSVIAFYSTVKLTARNFFVNLTDCLIYAFLPLSCIYFDGILRNSKIFDFTEFFVLFFKLCKKLVCFV